MDNWISVKDRLPGEFVPVLVCRKNRQGGQIVGAGQRDVGGGGGSTGRVPRASPTGCLCRTRQGKECNQHEHP